MWLIIKYKSKEYLSFKKNILQKILRKISTIVGVSYILDGFIQSQKQISKFFDYCKKHVDFSGFLKQSFFDFSKNQKGSFVNGPFINYILAS